MRKYQRWFKKTGSKGPDDEKCQRGLVNSVRFFICIIRLDRNAINYNRKEKQTFGRLKAQLRDVYC